MGRETKANADTAHADVGRGAAHRKQCGQAANLSKRLILVKGSAWFRVEVGRAAFRIALKEDFEQITGCDW
jgi:hypothetical protein